MFEYCHGTTSFLLGNLEIDPPLDESPSALLTLDEGEGEDDVEDSGTVVSGSADAICSAGLLDSPLSPSFLGSSLPFGWSADWDPVVVGGVGGDRLSSLGSSRLSSPSFAFSPGFS